MVEAKPGPRTIFLTQFEKIIIGDFLLHVSLNMKMLILELFEDISHIACNDKIFKTKIIFIKR